MTTRNPTPAARVGFRVVIVSRSEEHTSELQSQFHLVCRLLLEKKKRFEIIAPSAVFRSRSAVAFFPSFPEAVFSAVGTSPHSFLSISSFLLLFPCLCIRCLLPL